MYGLPFVIKRIEDKNGRTIYRSLPEEHIALPPNANYVMVEMLKYNVSAARRASIPSKVRWAEKRAPPPISPTAGLWVSRPALW
jgi:membrane peptidoglycan carboxypeptidase